MEDARSRSVRVSGRGDVSNLMAIRKAMNGDQTLKLSQFNIVQELSRNDMGTVYLAKLKDTDAQFVIKAMDKQLLLSRDKLNVAQNEKEILRMVDNPFLPTLYCYFEAKNLLYAITDYCPGGSLLKLREMHPGNFLPEEITRFYAAEVLTTLEYLHKLIGVVYRDLRPENVLIRSDGHIMLNDFCSSVLCSLNADVVEVSSDSSPGSSSGEKSIKSFLSSCCGKIFRFMLKKRNSDRLVFVAEPTLESSDEEAKTIGSALDLWTFGFFLYELLFGYMPYKLGPNQCRYSLYNRVREPLKFPKNSTVSPHARDLMKRLLEPGKKGKLDVNAIKKHPFFKGISWRDIRSMTPPYIPVESAFC